MRQLTDKLDVSADKVANFMLSPTLLSTHKVYPVANYGSAMAPVFTNLTLWVGAFMLVVLIKLNVDSEGIGAITHTQAYMGRWLLMAAISAVQAIVVTTGDLILGVQHEVWCCSTWQQSLLVGLICLLSMRSVHPSSILVRVFVLLWYFTDSWLFRSIPN